MTDSDTDEPIAALSTRIPTLSLHAYDAYNSEDAETAAANLNNLSGVTAVLAMPSDEEGDGHAEILVVIDRDGEADLNTLDADIQSAVEETPFEVNDNFDWFEEATRQDLHAAASAGDSESDESTTDDTTTESMSDDTPDNDGTDEQPEIDLDDDMVAISEDRHQELQSKEKTAKNLQTELKGTKDDLEEANGYNDLVKDVFSGILADNGPHTPEFYSESSLDVLRQEVSNVLNADENGGEAAALSAALSTPQTGDGGESSVSAAAGEGEHAQAEQELEDLREKRDEAEASGMTGAVAHFDEEIAELEGDSTSAAAASGDD